MPICRILIVIIGFCASATNLPAALIPVSTIPPLSERSLRLQVATDKTNYRVLEPILLTYWLENTSGEPQFIEEGERTAPTVFSATGIPINNCVRIFWACGSITIQLDERGRCLGSYSVLPPYCSTKKSQYDVLLNEEWFTFRCHELDPGRYFATATNISSDTAWFDVEFPTDDSEWLARSSYLEAMLDEPSCAKSTALGGTRLCNAFSRISKLSRMLSESHDFYFTQRVYYSLFETADFVAGVFPDSIPALASIGASRLAAEYIYLYPYSRFASLTFKLLDPSVLSADERRIAIIGLKRNAEICESAQAWSDLALTSAKRIEDYAQSKQ